MDKNLQYNRLNIFRLLDRARRLGLLNKVEEDNYADYIHELWQELLDHPILGDDARHIDDKMGNGDSIQLLSDALNEMGIAKF